MEGSSMFLTRQFTFGSTIWRGMNSNIERMCEGLRWKLGEISILITFKLQATRNTMVAIKF